MDDRKFLCGQCNNGYKNKSSLRRHINSIHNEKRYICGTCNKAYIRNMDYIKHITKFHQPLICKQGPELITSTPQPTSSRVKKPTALTIDNEVYTAICSRKRTQPTLVTSPKRIFLPPPPSNGAWSYRTSKF